MATCVKQFIYYGKDNEKNSGASEEFQDGSIFEDCIPIYQLGIQSLPGTKIYLNESTEPIIVGITGVYELVLDKKTEISKIQIDKKSLDLLDTITDICLIIDIVYDNGEEG